MENQRASPIHSEEVCVSFCRGDKVSKENSLTKESFVSAHGLRHFSAESLGCHFAPGISHSIATEGLWYRKQLSSCEPRSQRERDERNGVPVSPSMSQGPTSQTRFLSPKPIVPRLEHLAHKPLGDVTDSDYCGFP